MATGLELLAQLRARQESSRNQAALNPPGTVLSASSTCQPRNTPEPGHRPVKTPHAMGEGVRHESGCLPGAAGDVAGFGGRHACHFDVDVCGAVDCTGEGSIACLIELEELFAEAMGAAATVRRSPCMRACGSGPAVRVTCSRMAPGNPHTSNREIHLRIGSAQACHDILEAACATKARISTEGQQAIRVDDAATERELSMRERVMQRRADGMRWRALLSAGRKGQNEAQQAEELLKQALEAGFAAARLQGGEAIQRAARREARLIEAFERYANRDLEEYPSLGEEKAL